MSIANPDSVEDCKPSLTLLVCLYFEEECVEEFVRQVTPKLDAVTRNWELLFIDDGSLDETIPIVKQLASAEPRIKLIALNQNYGKEAAITAGIQYSTGDVVIMMDPDLQDPPERIKDFYDEVLAGNDLVWGIREAQSRGVLDALFSKIFWAVLRGFTGLAIPVNVSVMRGFNRRFANAFLTFPERNRFIEGIFACVGFKTNTITVENRPRYAGESKFTLRKRVALAVKAITAFSDRPLQLGVTLGSVGLTFSVTFALYLVGRKLFWGVGLEGWTSTIAIVLFMGSLNMLMLGLSSVYIGRIYRELKMRPVFLVNEIININEDEQG